MTYDDLLNDIEKLTSMKLCSIRPGAEIYIKNIDKKNNSLLLTNSKGEQRSRTLEEIKKIWTELQQNKIVHVDGVLGGSGSSRNQPETILANLPYIEWLKYNGKKHLSYVKENTHEYGTLREMNAIDQMKLHENCAKYDCNKSDYTLAIVSNDIKKSIDAFNVDGSGNVQIIEQGAYSLKLGSQNILFISSERMELQEKILPIISYRKVIDNKKFIKIGNQQFSFLKIAGIDVLVNIGRS